MRLAFFALALLAAPASAQTLDGAPASSSQTPVSSLEPASASGAILTSGDFDGDGRMDTAQLVYGPDRHTLVAKLSSRGRRPITISQGGFGSAEGVFLRTEFPGVYWPRSTGEERRPRRSMQIYNSAIGYGTVGVDEILIYWTGNEFDWFYRQP